MKTVIITLSVLIVLAFVFFAFVKNNETYQYEVLEKYEEFEVRKYDAAVFTSVELDSGSYSDVSSKGFRILAGYIFGGNEKEQKIAMTTPVTMDLNEKMTMRFLVPAEYTKEELPKPNNNDIEIEEMPEKIIAAIRFGGWADDEKIEKHSKKLEAALKKQGIEHTGNFSFMGYNAPFDPINRRNEVIVELVEYQN